MPPPTKRRRLEPTTIVEEISFDPSARHDYLTGFHKRKLERTKAAQKVAEKRAREEKIEQRKKIREERKADLERHVKEIDDMIRPVVLEDEGDGKEDKEDEGSNTSESEQEEARVEPVDHEAEYIDEDKYTSVVVEEMDVTREGLRKVNESSDEDGVGGEEDKPRVNETASSSKRTWTKDKPKDGSSKPKMKRKKFRYESKSERQVSRDKERSKNREQAKARRAK